MPLKCSLRSSHECYLVISLLQIIESCFRFSFCFVKHNINIRVQINDISHPSWYAHTIFSLFMFAILAINYKLSIETRPYISFRARRLKRVTQNTKVVDYKWFINICVPNLQMDDECCSKNFFVYSLQNQAHSLGLEIYTR